MPGGNRLRRMVVSLVAGLLLSAVVLATSSFLVGRTVDAAGVGGGIERVDTGLDRLTDRLSRSGEQGRETAEAIDARRSSVRRAVLTELALGLVVVFAATSVVTFAALELDGRLGRTGSAKQPPGVSGPHDRGAAQR